MEQDTKNYLTGQALRKIKKKYKQLKSIRSSKTKTELPEIFLEIKIAELENILRNFELIKKPPKKKQNIVSPGAKVVLERNNGKLDEFIITGLLENNPKEGKISYKSPLGRALLGHKVNDKIKVASTPLKRTYKIKKISYISL